MTPSPSTRPSQLVLRCLLVCLSALLNLAAFADPIAPTPAAIPPEPLEWNTLTNEYTANPGDISAHLYFYVSNVSTQTVVIDGVKTSCGCTSAQIPNQPWHIDPWKCGRMGVTVDLRGKAGSTILKGIFVLSSNAPKTLLISVTVPPAGTNTLNPAMADRLWNQEMAKADRQAVFKGDCVHCHLEPAFGKTGPVLYGVVCGVCHDSPRRASMVPDLNALKITSSPEYWRNIIAHGKTGTLMPGFAATDGGPLDDRQIDSLVNLFLAKYPPSKTNQP